MAHIYYKHKKYAVKINWRALTFYLVTRIVKRTARVPSCATPRDGKPLQTQCQQS